MTDRCQAPGCVGGGDVDLSWRTTNSTGPERLTLCLSHARSVPVMDDIGPRLEPAAPPAPRPPIDLYPSDPAAHEDHAF